MNDFTTLFKGRRSRKEILTSSHVRGKTRKFAKGNALELKSITKSNVSNAAWYKAIYTHHFHQCHICIKFCKGVIKSKSTNAGRNGILLPKLF